MFFVGIERNVPIRSSGTAIGLIYAYKAFKCDTACQVSVERCQCYWFSGFFPSSLFAEAHSLVSVHFENGNHSRWHR